MLLAVLGVVDPSLIVLPPPVTLIDGAVPTPLMLKVKGGVVEGSFSPKAMSAVLVPTAVGLN